MQELTQFSTVYTKLLLQFYAPNKNLIVKPWLATRKLWNKSVAILFLHNKIPDIKQIHLLLRCLMCMFLSINNPFFGVRDIITFTIHGYWKKLLFLL